MIIKELHVNGTFNYLWGKTVTDIDLSNHCAKSLVGSYDNEINNKTRQILEHQIDGEIFYICGVAKPFNYDNNFHLALMHNAGTDVTVDRNGVSVYVVDAVELPIDFEQSECDSKYGKLKAYNTCRNWRFAYTYRHLIKGFNNDMDINIV